jgi:hypothetical protein
MNRLNMKLKQMRSATPSKIMYTTCALSGGVIGFSKSRYAPNMKKRLLTDRIAWSMLYAGLFAYGHPFVVYHGVKCLEMQLRKKDLEHYSAFGAEILDFPHGGTLMQNDKNEYKNIFGIICWINL